MSIGFDKDDLYRSVKEIFNRQKSAKPKAQKQNF